MKYYWMLALLAFSCKQPAENPGAITENDADEALSGGTTTVFNATGKAYTFPFTGISPDLLAKHQAGDAVFEATFVSPPAPLNGGLGPVFNNTSCASCHRNDGRARPPLSSEPFNGLLFRISLPGEDEHGGPLPAPGFGLQVQTRAVFGTLPEMDVMIAYQEIKGSFADGEAFTLRKPVYTPASLYTALPSGAMLSPRIANPNFGLGLLEAVPEAVILANADENDTNQDGISGKVNVVWDLASGKKATGRFGWKASQPTLLQQAAAAFHGDIGITSEVFPEEECKGQAQDIALHPVEVSAEDLENLRIYLQTLAPPARRNTSDAAVIQGKRLFYQAGCQQCHLPKLQTGSPASGIAPQTIRPFTDLLLHDMGEGLADGRPDFQATGSEWRTAPLWGIGLSKTVSGHTTFLHDGRAENLTQAILWHGGEAQIAKEHFRMMPKPDRDLLLAFLNSL